jgi:hypothetical protein
MISMVLGDWLNTRGVPNTKCECTFNHFQTLDEPQIPSGVQHGHITTYPRGMRKENKLVLVYNRTLILRNFDIIWKRLPFLIASSFMRNGWFFDVSEISITGGSLISIYSTEKTANRWRFCDSDFFPNKNPEPVVLWIRKVLRTSGY